MKTLTKISAGLLVGALTIALSGCKSEEKGEEIQIPPGQVITYSNSEFLPISESYYTVDLQRLTTESNKFFSIEDLTPTNDKEKETIVKHIIPKVENKIGLYTLKVSMPRHGLSMSTFVLPNRINKPSVTSTLTVELFTGFPGYKLEAIKDQTVLAFEAEIENTISRAKNEFDIKREDMTIKQWIKFMKNYIGRDTTFLAFADAHGFSFSSSQDFFKINPFVFNNENQTPTLDESNSTATNRNVPAQESVELVVKARSMDPEADFLVFRWSLDGKLYSKEKELIKWTPDYDSARTETYPLKLILTDGGTPQEFNWDIEVADFNRSPIVESTCGMTTKEWQEWTCKIKAIDFDRDPVVFTVSDKATSARIKVNDQSTDDSTRKVSISGSSEIELKFTPNNMDAKRRFAYVEVTLTDGKMGSTTVPLRVIIEDINLPPEIVLVNGSPVQPLIPGSVAHEWDYCANADPDGVGAFRFKIEVRDPDNQTQAGIRSQIPDVVSTSFGGSLKDDLLVVTEAMGCPASSPEVSYFCFEWKPHNTPRTGTITLTLKDDHGGITAIPSPEHPLPITLTSEDRNVKPCLISRKIDSTLSDNQTNYLDQFTGNDDDDTSPWPQISNMDPSVMPLLTMTDASSTNLVFSKSYYDPTTWVTRFPKSLAGPSSAAYNAWFSRPLAGAVVLSRNGMHTTDITIAAGTIFKTSPLPSRIQYEVAQTLVMKKSDLAVMVPVKAYNRDAAVGKLNRWISAVPASFSSGVVTNPTILTGGGTVNVTRSSGAIAETLPAGSELGTSELLDGTDTVRYVTMDNVKFIVGQTAQTGIRVSRKLITANTGTVSVIPSATWPGPALTVNNLYPLRDVNNYTLARDLQQGLTMGVDRFCWNRELADSSVIPINTPLTFISGGPAGVQLTNSADLELEGLVQASRTDTSTLQTITQGSVIKTADLTQFTVAYDVPLNPGIASASLPVRRVNHINPATIPATNAESCYSWADTNYEPSFLNATSVKVTEGQALLDFEIKVTDNRNDPSSPNDPLDRHTFTNTFLGNTPSGSYLLCRESGDNMADISSPACTPCSNTTGTYFETASCFLRYKPVLADVAKAFTFNLIADDHGLNFPLNTNVRSQPTNVKVVELNDPPVHVDSNFLPIANNTENGALYLGDFIEGVETKYRIYMTDPDKGSDTKTLIAPVLQDVLVFWSPLSQWKSLGVPSGAVVELVGSTVPDPGGWGSKTTAQIKWTPKDKDAKRFAYTNGVVFKINACDAGSPDSPRQCAVGYYKIKTRNINNLPSNYTSLATLTVNADLYNDTQIYVKDTDFATNANFPYRPNPPNTTFHSKLSMCSTPGEFDCAADQTGWPLVLSTFDFPYSGNSSVSACQSGGVLTSRKVPQFVRYQQSGGPPNDPNLKGCVGTVSWNYSNASLCALDSTLRSYLYYFRWCPQKKHIGKHLVYFYLTDNGDEDIQGVSLPPQVVQIPVQLKVVAPVFFESPKKSTSTLDAVWWMQQAFSQLEYRYELFINNSRGNLVDVTMPTRAVVAGSSVGSPYLETRSYANPSVVSSTNNSGIYSLNLTTHRIFLVWKPFVMAGVPAVQSPYVSNPADQTTWPLFQLNVKDRTTLENQTVQFRVQVKSAVSPANATPVLASYWPPQANVLVKEQTAQVFQVTATDTNGDYLHYRWYLDGKLVSDSGASYSYTPGLDDAFLPLTSPGLHTLVAEILDGQERVTNTKMTWNVKVRNTVPLPQRMTYADPAKTLWTFSQSVIERIGAGTTISNLLWGPTVGVATTSGATTNNNLLFTGSYLRSSVVRNFAWRLQFTNASFIDNSSTFTTQGTEILPWSGGRKSEQISYIQSNLASLNNVLVASNKDPESAFSSTSDGVTLNPSLSSISSLNSGNACTGTCSYNFFKNITPPGSTAPLPGTVSSSGTQPSAGYVLSGNTYYFFSADQGATLKWNRAGSVANTIVALTGNDRIGDIAVNPTTKRLYVTVRDPALYRNLIYVYNITSVGTGSVTFVTSINVFDGVTQDNRILDLAVDPAKNRVYALLPGTGGVAALNDDGVTVPNTGNLSYIGVNNISSSYTDNVGEGRKLVFNPTSEILYGVAKDANEVFAIDTRSDAFTVKAFRTDAPLDEVVTFANDGLTLAINRKNGWIYKVW
jgi:hypothetical protein